MLQPECMFMAAKQKDQEFLENLVKALVQYPDDVKVVRNVDEMGVLLSLQVNPADIGQVIGRQGSTARAIRTLLRIIGLRNKARVNLKIEEPAGGRSPQGSRPTASSSEDDLKL